MHLKNLVSVGIISIIGFAGCATLAQDEGWTEPRPLGGELEAYKPPHSPTLNPVEFQEPDGVITLRQALSLALVNNPSLIAFSWEVRAREAGILQAGLIPNPVLGAEIEDFGGSGAARGFRESETTIQLSQLIELGGKRSARVRAASLSRDLAGWDYETRRIEVLTNVSKAFTEVLSAQERLTLTEEIVRLAEQVARTVSERVEAGKVSPIEETRTNAALSSIRIELEQAKRELEASRRRLAATWGSTDSGFETAVGDLDSVPSSIPPLEELSERLTQNPELARWAAELSARQAVIDLEKSRAIPDIIVSGGYRRLNETDDNAIIAGVSVPLPLFNRNQGAVLEARYRLVKSEEERRVAEVRITGLLSEAQKALSIAHAEITALKANVIPAAQEVFDATTEGYRLGKFGYLNVLDAQRTLFDARFRYLRALTDYHKAVADIEGLIGEPLSVIPSYPNEN